MLRRGARAIRLATASSIRKARRARDATQDPLRGALTQALHTTLADRAEPRVVVLAAGQGAIVRQLVREVRPGAHLTVVTAGLEPSERHVALAAAMPTDLLVDRSGTKGGPRRLASLIRYVRPGGVLLARLDPALQEAGDQQRRAYADSLRAEAGASISQLTVLRQHVLAVSASGLHPIIREAEVARLLEQRADLGRVLDLRPGVEVSARGVLRMNRSDMRFPVSDAWSTPPLALREYRDAVSGPGQVVRTGELVLPESFRHVFRPRVKNKWLARRPMDLFADPAAATTPKFAESAPAEGPRHLPGSYFHLDNELRGHFGHTTTEVLAKLWGWREAKRADPELKALIHANRHDAPAAWELSLLEAAGISGEDLVFTRDPVRVDRLVGATPMFGNPRYVHPAMASIWAGIADHLAAGGTADVPARIFVSRQPGGWRTCANQQEVEAYFEALGYTVVLPETYSLPDQVRLFRHARAIAGFAGSGMFGLMWAREPKPVILVASEAYPGRNEFLIAGVLGHDLDVVWSPAQTHDPTTDKRIRGVEAPFAVDLARDGEFIRAAARAGGDSSV